MSICACFGLALSAIACLTVLMLTNAGSYNWEELLDFYVKFTGISIAFYLVGTVATVCAGKKYLWNLALLNIELAFLVFVGLTR